MGRRRRYPVGAFVGRTQADLYREELGGEALARAIPLPDPDELLRRKPKVDQLTLVPELAFRTRRPNEAELYAAERRRASVPGAK
jgi:hypothetical protein